MAAEANGTAPRRSRPSRPAVIARLWRTAERQVAEIETRLERAGGDAAGLERDAKTLAVLARTVRDLVALDAEAKQAGKRMDKGAGGHNGAQGGPYDGAQAPVDLDAFRRDLAEKLAQLGALEPDA